MRFAVCIALSALLIYVFAPASPIVVLNTSQSVARGFYLRQPNAPLAKGNYVTVRASNVAPLYAAMRHFSRPHDWFIKRVAAAAGTRVCASGGEISLDGRRLPRARADRWGRVLPRWEGCRVLRRDEVFLLGDTQDSFDSRYWGAVRQSQIEGVWAPLWVFDARP